MATEDRKLKRNENASVHSDESRMSGRKGGQTSSESVDFDFSLAGASGWSREPAPDPNRRRDHDIRSTVIRGEEEE